MASKRDGSVSVATAGEKVEHSVLNGQSKGSNDMDNSMTREVKGAQRLARIASDVHLGFDKAFGKATKDANE
jgi:hypothetical protein